MNLWGLHHDPEIWGDDVDLFRPGRWEGRKSLWEFVPFLGGPRICPAQQLVLTQAIYVLCRLVKEFPGGIENRDETVGYVERTKITTESRNGVMIGLLPG